MNKFIFEFIFLVVVILQAQDFDRKREMDYWQNRKDIQITHIEKDIVKIKYNNGYVKYVAIRDMGSSLDKTAGSMQIFDLPNIDDSLYADKYILNQKIALGTAAPYPLLMGDFNNNGQIDMAGLYKYILDGEIGQAGIFELQDDSLFVQRFLYPYADSATTPTGITDVDHDGRVELNISRGQTFYNYKSIHPDSFPTHINFKHVMWQISGIVGDELYGNFDGDSLADVYYMGDDTLAPWGNKLYIAEYDPAVNNFVQKYRFAPPDWDVGGSAVGDFDGDGFKEIVAGNIHGNVYVMENRGDDTYTNSFTTSVNTSNAYLIAATNDMDKNGKTEFFVGASSYWNGVSGTKVFWFEATGDDSYEVKRTFFLNGTGVLGTTALYSYDINADGVDDLVFAFGNYVVEMVWNRLTDKFDMYYLYRQPIGKGYIQAATVYDVFNDANPDLFISIYGNGNVPGNSTLWFLSQNVSKIKTSINFRPKFFDLLQNYPNPFNGSTKIEFKLAERSKVDLTIYTFNGKEVRRLIMDQGMALGKHGVLWDGKNNNGKEVSSGIYLYVLSTDRNIQTKKLIYLK